MAEYIDREAAVKAANEWVSEACMAPVMRVNWLFDKLQKVPVADVAPVVHARWVDGKCSNCGVDIPTDDAHDAIFENECRFCYYCGAKMDKDCKHKGWIQEPCHGKSVDYCRVWDCTLRNLETTFCSYGEPKEV